jgi:hypothetical protein
MGTEYLWNAPDRVNRSTRRKTCPSAPLSIKNLISTGLGSNQGLHDERPATNRLSHGTASLKF